MENRSTSFLNDLLFSEDDVRKALKLMKPSLSPDSDGLNSYFMKRLSFSVCYPLCLIFNKSFEQGMIPASWKKAVVIPLFKKGDSSSVVNYRPVSLCSVICKIMESIINSKIIDFLNVQQVLSDKQFGFRKNKSCTQQLLSCRNVKTSQLDQGECLDVVYIDFSKAFDSVSHEKLLYKLSNYGLG